LSLFLTLAAALMIAGSLYVTIINRVLGQLCNRWGKMLVFILSFVLIFGGMIAVALRLLLVQAQWLLIIPLVVIAINELYHQFVKRRNRGEQAVRISGETPSIFRPVNTTDLQIYQYEIMLDDLPMDQLRVVHLSDLHVNHAIPAEYYHSVVNQASKAEPDLIFISGDFVTSWKYLSLLSDILKPLKARAGIYAILGNHDYWVGKDGVLNVLAAAGITMLGDQTESIQMNGNASITLCGYERPWGGRKELPELDEGEFALALSHTADHIYKLNHSGIRAVFSGHYHAGQFQVPFFGPVVIPSAYGRRFAHGHYKVNGTHLFVSAGIGADEPSLRLYCPPDLFVVDFKKKA